jgi:hypothetical protein
MGNLLWGSVSMVSAYPVRNFLPASLSAVGFVGGGDSYLLPSSPFPGMAIDGTNPGADVGAILDRKASTRLGGLQSTDLEVFEPLSAEEDEPNVLLGRVSC